jgi:hypothetical protein
VNHRGSLIFGLSIFLTATFSSAAGAEKKTRKNQVPELVLVNQIPLPVLTTRSPGAEDNQYGFEGGRVVRVGSTYHLFTSEMAGDPIWVRMRLAHWISEDGRIWERMSTLYESEGGFDGREPRASLWSPIPVFDELADRWNLFYVAYRSAPNTNSQFLMAHDGRIWRAVSLVKGLDGISGPYKDIEIIIQPGPDSDPWEGLQGTSSFFPYRAGSGWYAFYGSANTESLPIRAWRVGLATAYELAGPWRRRSDLNPAPIEEVFIENPIVTELDEGGFLCVYDCQTPDAIGYAFSTDGSHWEPGHHLAIQTTPGQWSADVRTPLGLIPEGDDQFTLFYTGFEGDPQWERLLEADPQTTCAVGMVELKLVWKKREE